MINWWFGARWFGIRFGVPLSNNPFYKGFPGTQTKINHQLLSNLGEKQPPFFKRNGDFYFKGIPNRMNTRLTWINGHHFLICKILMWDRNVGTCWCRTATVKSSCQNAQPRSQHLESRRYRWIWVHNLLKLQNVNFVEPIFFGWIPFLSHLCGPSDGFWSLRIVVGRRSGGDWYRMFGAKALHIQVVQGGPLLYL